MPRFVLLHHECPSRYEKPSHWDFMLEANGVLRTWELRELPSAWATMLGEIAENSGVKAVSLPDHRLDYLDYEGPVSDDRGSVRRCDCGTYELLEESQDLLDLRLGGKLLRGTVCLSRLGGAWWLDQYEE